MKLTATATLPDLGPKQRRGILATTEIDDRLDEIFEESKFARTAQQLIRATIYLWHDHLDASHSISQGIETRDGSFVHGIMHRREPDYGNARYWFRRVGEHPAFAMLAERAAPVLASATDLEKQLIRSGRWDAMGFIEECEKASGDESRASILGEVQAAELRLLVEYFAEAMTK